MNGFLPTYLIGVSLFYLACVAAGGFVCLRHRLLLVGHVESGAQQIPCGVPQGLIILVICE